MNSNTKIQWKIITIIIIFFFPPQSLHASLYPTNLKFPWKFESFQQTLPLRIILRSQSLMGKNHSMKPVLQIFGWSVLTTLEVLKKSKEISSVVN